MGDKLLAFRTTEHLKEFQSYNCHKSQKDFKTWIPERKLLVCRQTNLIAHLLAVPISTSSAGKKIALFETSNLQGLKAVFTSSKSSSIINF